MLLSPFGDGKEPSRDQAGAPLLPLVESAPRYLFFTGKGGVGKTSLSTSTAIALADRGRRVLLVSTDPASNLDEVLQCPLGRVPRPVPGVPGLVALNIDPTAATEAYKRRVLGPLEGVLPESALAGMDEQLSGACTVEIAAFNEFASLLTAEGPARALDHVVFDTAPTGHTLRLLSLPGAWQGFVDSSRHGASCLGPLAGLTEQKNLFRSALDALQSAKAGVVLVSRPDSAALSEADRARAELERIGIRSRWLILNGVFEPASSDDPIAESLARRGRKAIEAMPERLRLPRRLEIPLIPRPLIGIPALRSLVAPAVAESMDRPISPRDIGGLPGSLDQILDGLSAEGHGVIMTLGKGGVGKTHLARAIARELARRGAAVHLTTTDPAANLATLASGSTPLLRVSRIDGPAEVVRYRQEILDTVGHDLDPMSRDLLEEDLRSPCTEEVAVFRAFAAAVAEGEDGFVVVDTAPTGHTLLLLDAALSYHREIARQPGAASDSVRKLLPRLRDPLYTHMLIVTLPQATPVHEAESLEEDLHRAGIRPYAWVINQSFLAADTSDPLLTTWARNERPFIDEVMERTGGHCALVPWSPATLEDPRPPVPPIRSGYRLSRSGPSVPDKAAERPTPPPSVERV